MPALLFRFAALRVAFRAICNRCKGPPRAGTLIAEPRRIEAPEVALSIAEWEADSITGSDMDGPAEPGLGALVIFANTLDKSKLGFYAERHPVKARAKRASRNT